MLQQYQTIIVCVVGAMLYSFVTYWSQRMDEDDPELFQPQKLIRTVIVGLIVGVYAYSRGLDLELSNFRALAEASGAVVIAEQASKGIWRFIKGRL